MAYTRQDTEGAFLGGNPLPPSEATPQRYLPEHEHADPPPHCVPAAAPSMHCSGYDHQWNAPTLHSSVQDQRHGMPVPHVNGMAGSYGVWCGAQQSASFTPATGAGTTAVTPYMSQNQNHEAANAANGPMAYYQDNRITATSNRDLHGQFTAGAQPGGVVDYGPSLTGGTSARSAAGNAMQTFAPDGEAPAPSESLRTLTRRYVLDPGTHLEAVNIGPNRYGRLKIIIALEVADGV